MNIYQILKMSLKSLSSNKKRSFLTMLGVMMGIAAVIAIMAIIQGVTNSIEDKFNEMGANLINVYVVGRSNSNRKITFSKVQQFEKENSDIVKAIVPSLSGKAVLKYGNDNVSTTIEGVLATYSDVREVELEEGWFVTDVNVSQKECTAVIGSYIKDKYFKNTSAIGEKIKLNGQQYRIIGVLKQKSTGAERSTDNKVFIPYTSAVRLTQNANISAFAVALYSNDNIKEAVSRTESFLYSVYQDTDAYYVIDPREVSDNLDSVLGMLTMMLVGIAGISLVVGGVGIMNIMLVSVTERTREIGIRKAIGASRRSIMLQFLVEAGIISGLGGVMGVVLGEIASRIADSLMTITPEVTTKSIVVSVVFSVGIGMFFGWSPARRASKLRPIDALRTE